MGRIDYIIASGLVALSNQWAIAEVAGSRLRIVALDKSIERLAFDEIQNLREDGAATVHGASLSANLSGNSNAWHSFSVASNSLQV